MADVTKVKASDGVIYTINDADDYTKEEVDTLLAGKADVGDSYTKAEADALLADKASTSDVESALALKANVVDVYSKTEANALLADKADVGVSYTKAEDDALLLAKANAADVYTITQTDALLDVKADVDDSSTTATMATWSASKLNTEFQGKANSSDVYTKAEVDALIGGLKMKCYYTTVSISDTQEHTVDISSLNLQSADDYFVIINGGEAPSDYSGSTYNGGANHPIYVSSKTASAFGVRIDVAAGLVNTRGPVVVSCQVIY